MNYKEKRQLENELLVQGLSGLNDPDLIQQLADMVSNFPGDKHDFFRDLLNECDAAERYEAYHAMAPKLTFKPLSFPQYEAQIAERAGQMVSQKRMRVEGQAPKPIEIGGHRFAAVPASLATNAVATLRCHQCNKCEQFLGDSPAGAMIAGRKAGWVREPGINKEACANCAAKIAAEEVVVLNRKENLIIQDNRRVN